MIDILSDELFIKVLFKICADDTNVKTLRCIGLCIMDGLEEKNDSLNVRRCVFSENSIS